MFSSKPSLLSQATCAWFGECIQFAASFHVHLCFHLPCNCLLLCCVCVLFPVSLGYCRELIPDFLRLFHFQAFPAKKHLYDLFFSSTGTAALPCLFYHFYLSLLFQFLAYFIGNAVFYFYGKIHVGKMAVLTNQMWRWVSEQRSDESSHSQNATDSHCLDLMLQQFLQNKRFSIC